MLDQPGVIAARVTRARIADRPAPCCSEPWRRHWLERPWRSNSWRTFAYADFDWIDDARRRRVPARLYWPNTSSLRNPVPLVVFSHGLGQSRTGYSYLGRHWSSRGVRKPAPATRRSDSSVWAGNPLALLDRIEMAAQEHEALARAQDLRFALTAFSSRMAAPSATGSTGADRCGRPLLRSQHDPHRGGRSGHPRWTPPSGWDPRIMAGIVISAPPFYGERDLRAVLRAVMIPTLHVTATEDVIQLPAARPRSPIASQSTKR